MSEITADVNIHIKDGEGYIKITKDDHLDMYIILESIGSYGIKKAINHLSQRLIDILSGGG